MKRAKIKRILICILICILFLLTACGTSKLEKQLDLGAKYLEELDYDNAITAYDEAIAIDKANIDAYVGKAKAYEGKSATIEDTDESLDALFQAYLTLDNMLGDTSIVYVGINESEESALAYQKAITDEFVEEISAYLDDLIETRDVETIKLLRNKYAEYFDINFDSYIAAADKVTVTGVTSVMTNLGNIRYSENEITDGEHGWSCGITLDTPVTMPDGVETDWLLMGWPNGNMYGARVTVTGTLYIDNEETDKMAPISYRILYNQEDLSIDDQ